jgi:hypothetical protein
MVTKEREMEHENGGGVLVTKISKYKGWMWI